MKICKRGHEMIGDNIVVRPNRNTTECRKCKRQSGLKWQRNYNEQYRLGQIHIRNRERFGSLREIVIKRDKEKCVICSISREQHKLKFGKDITVDHKDGKGRNTLPEDRNHSIDNLQTLCLFCHGHKDGIRVPKKMNVIDVINIRHMKGSLSNKLLARMYNISPSSISAIHNKRIWMDETIKFELDKLIGSRG